MKAFMNAFNMIGSVLPLSILCFIIVLVRNKKGKDREKTKLLTYVILSIILFLILLRT